MKIQYFKILFILLLPLTAAVAEIDSASSAPFSFPLTQPVKRSLHNASGVMALRVRPASLDRSLAVTWEVPASLEAKSGTITLFNLQGKALLAIPLASKTGSAVLPVAKGQRLAGVYIMKLTFGAAAATIKFAACK